MKKFLAMAVALTMVVSMGVVAMAENATKIALSESSASLKMGGTETATVTVTITPDNADDAGSLAVKSSDEEVATAELADKTITITAKKAGSATVTAYIGDADSTQVKAECSVTVAPADKPLQSISLNKTTLTLKEDGTDTLTVTYDPPDTTDSKDVTWTSSDAAKASVNDGTVTGVTAGEATITAKVGEKTATCKVTVEAKEDVQDTTVNTVEVTGDATVEVGKTITLTAVAKNQDGQTIDGKTFTWTSSADATATVADGTVTGVAEGAVTITAAVDGKSGTKDITVTKAADPGTDPEDPGTDPEPTPEDPAKPGDTNADTGGSNGGSSGGSSGGSGGGSSNPTASDVNSAATASAIEAAITAVSRPGAALPAKAETASTASGSAITVIPVKMSSGDAISVDTADLLGSGSSKMGLQANVNSGAMVVTIPGGFGKVTEPGRIYYPMTYDTNPYFAAAAARGVKGNGARTEVLKAGGDMQMPVEVTLSLKTRLAGKVNVYYYNDLTGRYTLLASPEVRDGRVTFATRQMGGMVITTGTI